MESNSNSYAVELRFEDEFEENLAAAIEELEQRGYPSVPHMLKRRGLIETAELRIHATLGAFEAEDDQEVEQLLDGARNPLRTPAAVRIVGVSHFDKSENAALQVHVIYLELQASARVNQVRGIVRGDLQRAGADFSRDHGADNVLHISLCTTSQAVTHEVVDEVTQVLNKFGVEVPGVVQAIYAGVAGRETEFDSTIGASLATNGVGLPY